jgi:hypothetical protein
MRIFVSYSRHDAAFVTRLVAQLEAEGHELWIDTEDIRGSEQWRVSIVRGIRNADVVVLVVSRRSVQSEEVEREITVAADEDRPIVPIVLEPAELTDGIRYELAGVQQVSFIDRPFEEAAAELRHALALVTGPAPARPHAPEAMRTRRARRAPLMAAVILLILAGLARLVLGAGSGDDEGADISDLPASGDQTNGRSDSEGADSAESVTLGTTVWFAGYEIGVDGATLDPVRRVVAVDVMLTNVQPAEADPLHMIAETALEWNGRRFTAFCSCNSLPPDASLSTALTFDVDEDFSLPSGVLVFGEPGQHQAVVPLDGSPPDTEQPTTSPVTGVADDGAGTTFTVERVEVVPAQCQGLSDVLRYGPGPADEVSVIVWGTGLTTHAPNVGLGNAYLVLPDGTRIGSNSLTGVIYVLNPDQPERDVPVCFSVPAPIGGEYRMVVTALGVGETDPTGITFTL